MLQTDTQVANQLVTRFGVVVALVIVAIAGVIALGVLFLRSWVERLARQAFDKELETHKHRLQIEADAIRVEQQRQLRDFDLFTQERHRAYAGVYKRLLIAEGAVGMLRGLRKVPAYEEYSKENVRALLEEKHFAGSTVEGVLSLWDTDRRGAIKLLREALSEWEKQDALRKVQLARNYQLLRELYFSETVRGAVEAAYVKLNGLAREWTNPWPGPTSPGLEKESHEALITLRNLLQAELARGDYVAAPAPISVAADVSKKESVQEQNDPGTEQT